MLFQSLPVLGKDAKVRDRFREAVFQPGRVRAKTGFIYGASSLSGYMLADDDTMLVFSFVVNYRPDQTRRTNNARFKKLRKDVLAIAARGEALALNSGPRARGRARAAARARSCSSASAGWPRTRSARRATGATW